MLYLFMASPEVSGCCVVTDPELGLCAASGHSSTKGNFMQHGKDTKVTTDHKVHKDKTAHTHFYFLLLHFYF